MPLSRFRYTTEYGKTFSECSSPLSSEFRDRDIQPKPGDTFKFFEKTLSNLGQLVLCKNPERWQYHVPLRVERVGHRVSLARSRAMASCPETAEIEPDSSSASLRSASRSQASSTSGSESRLAISRSSRCDRSTGVTAGLRLPELPGLCSPNLQCGRC